MENNIENKNVCVGILWLGDDEHSIKIQQDANGNFINSEEELKDWAKCLNDPWSDTSVFYSVHPNYLNANEWIAKKQVIVFDDIEVQIAARADTPQDAIIACDTFMQEVINKYCVKEEDDE